VSGGSVLKHELLGADQRHEQALHLVPELRVAMAELDI
jgi:hypothetical protein